MNQTNETDQSNRPAFVMSYETGIQNSGDEDTYREETATLTFTNPWGLFVPDSEWQCNAEFLLCEYGIPDMAPNGKMIDWIASDFQTTENPPGENGPNEYYYSTLTAIQFTEMGEAASVMGKVMLRLNHPKYGEKDAHPEIMATADVLLTLDDSPENRAALMEMVGQPGNP